jgi:hypothetical protein
VPGMVKAKSSLPLSGPGVLSFCTCNDAGTGGRSTSVLCAKTRKKTTGGSYIDKGWAKGWRMYKYTKQRELRVRTGCSKDWGRGKCLPLFCARVVAPAGHTDIADLDAEVHNLFKVPQAIRRLTLIVHLSNHWMRCTKALN